MTTPTHLFTAPRFYSDWTQIILDIQETPFEDRDPVDQMLLEAIADQVRRPHILTPEEDKLWAQFLS